MKKYIALILALAMVMALLRKSPLLPLRLLQPRPPLLLLRLQLPRPRPLLLRRLLPLRLLKPQLLPLS